MSLMPPQPGPGFTGDTSSLGAPRGVAQAPDLQAMAIQGILTALNNQGQVVGGSPGYTVSAAPQRAAATAGYNTAVGNANNVYSQASQAVLARAPQIQQGYDNGTAAIQAQARQQAIDTQSNLSQQASDYAKAVQGLGLSGIALPTMARTQAVDQANTAKLQANADSWAGFNSGAAQRALANNTATSDSFLNQKGVQDSALAQMLQKTLAGMKDTYVKGSAGKLVGAPTVANLLSGYNMLAGYGKTNTNTALSTSKLQQANLQHQFSNGLAQAKAAHSGVTFNPGAMGY